MRLLHTMLRVGDLQRSIDFYTDQQAVHITLGKVHNPTFGKVETHDATDLDDPDPR